MTRVLIVDDSALMRKHLSGILANEAGLEVEVARNGIEALEQLDRFDPDVITLDINMPEMDGLTALSYIMTKRPTPVVMFSSLTEKGALATFEAMALGAIDYIPKPDGTISLSLDAVRTELVSKVRAAAKARLRGGPGSTPKRPPAVATTVRPALSSGVANAAPPRHFGLIVIGVSTGGPRTLEEILPQLPADFPWPVLVAQHMPQAFTAAFAKRMDGLCALTVAEVAQPTALEVGTIYIAQGGADMLVADRGGRLTAVSRAADPRYSWHPSVEALVGSALAHCQPERLVTVMLTGMGDDGAEAMTEVHRRGGRTIAESERSAVVFGMPCELIKRGGATSTLDAHAIAGQLIQWTMH